MSYRTRDQRVADEVSQEARLACRRCTNLTLGTMLSEHGGMCLPCFDAYRVTDRSLGGFTTGRRDSPQQAEMRKRLKPGVAADVLLEAA